MKNMIEFYIATGMQGLHHTLRQVVTDTTNMKYTDSYVKRLSPCVSRSIELGFEFVEKFKKLEGVSESYTVTFNTNPIDKIMYESGVKITKTEQQLLELLNEGIVPVGKARGVKFSDLDDEHLIWFYNEASKKTNNIISSNIASASLVVLIERGVVTNVNNVNKVLTPEKNISKAKLSEHVGLVGQRMELIAKIERFASKWNERFEHTEYIYRLLMGNNIITYKGSVYLGGKGESVKMKATVSKKNEFNGVKQTVISRPHLL